ncbi:MAG: Mrp/NBP35 family ATP-binding protein [Desulfuromonadales bacterium]|nr:Mrp/NBP35 family ATP-binding protein [Desulfuromonadales bacterium]MDT8423158.1 Mrp/NBP35 family ATP-binding protein [Desulfuromonadales bacterium]
MGSDCNSCADTGCAARTRQGNETDKELSDRRQLQQRLCRISRKLLIMSGKGGVGKSTTAVNLALAMAKEGRKVGLLDVDIHGPSVPKMLGLDDYRPEVRDGDGIEPAFCQGVKVMSIGFLLKNSSDAVIWRGSMKHGAIRQFLSEVNWGELDDLIIDCPPGTGDEPLSVVQLVGATAQAVIVTTPQAVALLDVSKSITFCRNLELPIAGIVENMSGFHCPHCQELINLFGTGGGEQLASEMKVPFLGRIPGDPQMVIAGDCGTPLVSLHATAPAAEAFVTIARNLIT